MKSSITFDTLQYANKLKESGMDQKEAEAITETTADAIDKIIDAKELPTRFDLKDLRFELKIDISDLKAEIKSDIGKLKDDLSEKITNNTWKAIVYLGIIQSLVIASAAFTQHLFK